MVQPTQSQPAPKIGDPMNALSLDQLSKVVPEKIGQSETTNTFHLHKTESYARLGTYLKLQGSTEFTKETEFSIHLSRCRGSPSAYFKMSI